MGVWPVRAGLGSRADVKDASPSEMVLPGPEDGGVGPNAEVGLAWARRGKTMFRRATIWRHQCDVGMSFGEQRQRMVETQLANRGIRDPRVLAAMSRVPREEFVAPGLRDEAYSDAALPIDCGQTISQPYTVAFMCEALNLTGNERVLEIGTGTGYGAAVLSEMVGEVHTVERIAELADRAMVRLKRLGYGRIEVHVDDGSSGWPGNAPYDAIVVTAGARVLPAPYRDQLVDGGRIVVPLGSSLQNQYMHRFTLESGGLRSEILGAFTFVPLVGRYGHPE